MSQMARNCTTITCDEKNNFLTSDKEEMVPNWFELTLDGKKKQISYF